MNRVIKFRGRRLSDRKWIKGDLIHNRGETFIAPDGIQSPLATADDFKVDPATVGQFTGLLDKNGEEIYEGDIFGIHTNDKNTVNRHCRFVGWIKDRFYLIDRGYGDRLCREITTNTDHVGIAEVLRQNGLDYGVIGNIHDNFELLKNQ